MRAIETSETVRSHCFSLEMAGSPVLESAFIDLQRFDPVLKSRGRHAKLDPGSRWSGNPASALCQGGVDNLQFAVRPSVTLESYRRFSPRCLRRSPLGKPQLIN